MVDIQNQQVIHLKTV